MLYELSDCSQTWVKEPTGKKDGSREGERGRTWHVSVVIHVSYASFSVHRIMFGRESAVSELLTYVPSSSDNVCLTPPVLHPSCPNERDRRGEVIEILGSASIWEHALEMDVDMVVWFVLATMNSCTGECAPFQVKLTDSRNYWKRSKTWDLLLIHLHPDWSKL